MSDALRRHAVFVGIDEIDMSGSPAISSATTANAYSARRSPASTTVRKSPLP